LRDRLLRRHFAEDEINRVVVAPNYFATMGIPIVNGREFTERDDRRAPEVAVINEAAARKFFPGENPIGRRFGHRPEGSGNIEIVGVLRDVRYNNLRELPPPTLYIPYLQSNPEDMVFSVRTAVDPASIISPVRQAIWSTDRNQPVARIQTMEEIVDRQLSTSSQSTALLSAFALLALLLASIGLDRVLSYAATQRTTGIRARSFWRSASRSIGASKTA